MSRSVALFLSVAVVLAMAMAFAFVGPYLGETRLLTGPDAYMRLMQAERLWQTGDWFADVSPLTNFPWGEVRHWTRPLDAILLAGAVPLSAVMDRGDALFWWSCVTGPVLQALAVLVLAWGTRSMLPNGGLVLAAVLFVALPGGHAAFAAFRPDHHGFLVFLYLVQVMALLRAVGDGRRETRLLLAGTAAGLALWTSPEGLLGVLTVSVGLGLLWLVEGEDWLAAIARYFQGFALVTAVALMLERPPVNWLAVEFDRISIVHVVLAGVLAAAWTALASMTQAAAAGRGGRFLAGLAGIAVPALVMLAAFPRFFGGPFADVPPVMYTEWFDRIDEAKPLLTGKPGDTALLLFSLGGLPFALAAAFHRLRRKEPDALVFLVALLLPLPLALHQRRWTPYVELAMVVPWVWLLLGILRWDRPLFRVPAFVSVLLGPVAVALVAGPGAEEGKRPWACDWANAAESLRSLPGGGDGILSIFTFVHQGPELAWRTGAAVVGTPYQRNEAGILDTHRVFAGHDPAEARRILTERGIDCLAICTGIGEPKRYLADGESFYARLMGGEVPDWLVPVGLPDGVGTGLRLWRVAPGPLQVRKGRVERRLLRRGAGAVERGGLENR